MSETFIPSDSFWNLSSTSTTARSRSSFASRSLLFFVDESPEFHNPYSDLNLFLYQKIKEEIPLLGKVKKWSIKLQEELLQKITPDFQKKFPQYRLSVSAMRKIWDKVV